MFDKGAGAITGLTIGEVGQHWEDPYACPSWSKAANLNYGLPGEIWNWFSNEYIGFEGNKQIGGARNLIAQKSSYDLC